VEFIENLSEEGKTGALYSTTSNRIEIINSNFIKNKVNSSSYGAAYFGELRTLEISGTLFEDNTAF